MSWLQTRSGLAFDLERPAADQVAVEDLAAALSMQCRYNGHTGRHYSVAEHCCHVSDWVAEHSVGPDLALGALLHDASEAFVGDMPAPLKWTMTPPAKAWWDGVVADVDRVIAEALGVDPDLFHHRAVKTADLRILHDEATAIWGDHRARPWGIPGKPLGVTIHFWDPGKACHEWLRRLEVLGGR